MKTHLIPARPLFTRLHGKAAWRRARSGGRDRSGTNAGGTMTLRHPPRFGVDALARRVRVCPRPGGPRSSGSTAAALSKLHLDNRFPGGSSSSGVDYRAESRTPNRRRGGSGGRAAESFPRQRSPTFRTAAEPGLRCPDWNAPRNTMKLPRMATTTPPGVRALNSAQSRATKEPRSRRAKC